MEPVSAGLEGSTQWFIGVVEKGKRKMDGLRKFRDEKMCVVFLCEEFLLLKMRTELWL